MKFDYDYVEKLVKLLSDSNLTELVLEDNDQAIILKKQTTVVSAGNLSAMYPSTISTVSPKELTTKEKIDLAINEIEDKKAREKKESERGRAITSPMVGTFYKASAPDAPAFVNVGDTVAKGQVVCIIEAMKLMNEIESEVSGKVIKICVEDGQSVEYGQVLMYVE